MRLIRGVLVPFAMIPKDVAFPSHRFRLIVGQARLIFGFEEGGTVSFRVPNLRDGTGTGFGRSGL
jgi:hypothetical protein